VTFAQSALAPAKITRVSVTHHGEYPHLDVIVEDEQLSLAIGKRGQNVRLASELIGARIDIKSESDVKDEVADALARMLQDAMAESDLPTFADDGEGGLAEDDEIDWSDAPGIGPVTAEALGEAGYATYADLLSADLEELENVEHVGPKTAQALLDWAAERISAGPVVEEAPTDEEPAEEEESGLGGDEFMEALSRALAESEQQRSEAEQAAESSLDDSEDEAGESGEEPVET